MKIDAGFAGDLIAQALRGGADQAEVFIKTSRNLSVEIKEQTVDSLKSSQSFGYSLRVIRSGRLGFCYSTSMHDHDAVIKRALDSAGGTDKDSYLDFPCQSTGAGVAVFDPAVQEIHEDEAIRKVMLLEQSAYDQDRRIRKIRKASGSFTTNTVSIANSKAVHAGYSSTSCAAQIMAIAEQGDENQIGWDFQGSRFLDDINFEQVGRTAADNAVRLLGARKIQGSKAQVILDRSVAAEFLGVFAASLSSESVQKGKSVLKDRMHGKVISSKLNIIDSGLIPGKLGSRPVDDEGVPTAEKMLLREGILEGFLYNTYTARKDGVASTGNAVRGGFSALPSVGITNLFIATGTAGEVVSKQGLFKSVHSGLYVVDAMGIHTANPISGDFSIGVTGLWIEGGAVQFPVKEAVIAGNILGLFNNIEAVADDLKFYGNIGAPSIVISGMDISA